MPIPSTSAEGFRWSERPDPADPTWTLIEARLARPNSPTLKVQGGEAAERLRRFVTQTCQAMAAASPIKGPELIAALKAFQADAVALRGEAPMATLVEPWMLAMRVGIPMDGRRNRELTATLWPRGRGSTKDDWETLGFIGRTLDVPVEAMQKASEAWDENGPLVMRWSSPA